MKNKRTRRRNKKKVWKKRILILIIFILLIVIGKWAFHYWGERSKVQNLSKTEIPEWIDRQIIDVDGVSRNGKRLSSIKDIVVHYVGNPGSTAQGKIRRKTNKCSKRCCTFFIFNGRII